MESLSIEVIAIRFSGDDFAVIAAVTDDGDEVTLTGPLAHVHEGEALTVGGDWRSTPSTAASFTSSARSPVEPASETALLGYLQTVKHVGPRGAA